LFDEISTNWQVISVWEYRIYDVLEIKWLRRDCKYAAGSISEKFGVIPIQWFFHRLMLLANLHRIVSEKEG
jgi:hypothetical protein